MGPATRREAGRDGDAPKKAPPVGAWVGVDEFTAFEKEKKKAKRAREKAAEYQKRYEEVQKQLEEKPYVLVLFDGDAMLLHENLVSGSTEAGRVAAEAIQHSAIEHIREQTPGIADKCSVVTVIIEDTRAVAEEYAEYNIETHAGYRLFIKGFNGHGRNSIIEAPNIATATEDRMIAEFEHNLSNPHCQRVIFGASKSDAYTQYLQKQHSGPASGMISILQALQPDQSLDLRETNFPTATFFNIFSDYSVPDPPAMPGRARPEPNTATPTTKEPWTQEGQLTPPQSSSAGGKRSRSRSLGGGEGKRRRGGGLSVRDLLN